MSDLIYGIYLVFLGVIFFYIGVKVAEISFKNTRSYSYYFDLEFFIKIGNRFSILFFLLQVVIFIYFFNIFVGGYESRYEYLYEKHFRPMGTIFSTPLLLMQLIMPLFFLKQRFAYLFSIFICILLSFVYFYFEASRAGVLPLFGVALSALVKRRYIRVFCVLVLCIIGLGVAASARGFEGRYSTSFWDVFVQLDVLAASIGAILYTTAFSIFQFSYVVVEQVGHFDTQSLIYSILPVPQFLYPNPPNYFVWRVDIYRPMGALSEMERVSFIVMAAFFVILGGVSAYIDSIRQSVFRLIASLFFVVVCISMFQYNLRSIQWYVYFILLLVFLDAYLKRYFSTFDEAV